MVWRTMQILIETIATPFPLYVYMGVGLLLRRTGVIKEELLPALNRISSFGYSCRYRYF